MKGDPAVSEALVRHDRTDILAPAPVVAELEYGLARLPRSRRKQRLQTRLEKLLEEIPRAVWTDDVSRHFGRIKAASERRGERLEDFDLAVAAHALSLGATLVTDNLRHMKRIRNLRLENWRSGDPYDAANKRA